MLRLAPFLAVAAYLNIICAGLGAQQTQPEITSQDTSTTFRAKVNLVSVPVVVRDASGHAVGGLKQEDFQLFDKGKLQVISKFSIEKSGAQEAVVKTSGAPDDAADSRAANHATVPERFLLYLFDDLHIDSGDLTQVRKAAAQNFATLQPSDRAAILTTSGQIQLDFTDDREQLNQTLAKLTPRHLDPGTGNCPHLTYYQADLIANRNDQEALGEAVTQVIACFPKITGPAAQSLAQSAARQTAGIGEHDTLVTFDTIEKAARRMAAMPGQRTLILVSPGFLATTPTGLDRLTNVIEAATRANVIVNGLDARGLWSVDGDASDRGLTPTLDRLEQQFARAAALAQEDVIAELAEGTGGTFFHNNNDLVEGFRRTASAPEYIYILGFSPENLKMDGKFHQLKVKIKTRESVTVQARRGYFAPKRAESEEESAKRQIEEAIFSRDELHDIPVDLHTQFFKTGDVAAKLTVLAHVDLTGVHLQKIDGRNRNQLTVVAALFDRNGNYITGQKKDLNMELRDETLRKLSSGITIKEDFDTKPGNYVVRLVVWEKNGQAMAAENGSVEIP